MSNQKTTISINPNRLLELTLTVLDRRLKFEAEQSKKIFDAIVTRRAALEAINNKRGFLKRKLLTPKFTPSDEEILKIISSREMVDSLEICVRLPSEYNRTEWFQYNCPEVRGALDEYLRGYSWVVKVQNLHDSLSKRPNLPTTVNLDFDVYHFITRQLE